MIKCFVFRLKKSVLNFPSRSFRLSNALLSQSLPFTDTFWALKMMTISTKVFHGNHSSRMILGILLNIYWCDDICIWLIVPRSAPWVALSLLACRFFFTCFLSLFRSLSHCMVLCRPCMLCWLYFIDRMFCHQILIKLILDWGVVLSTLIIPTLRNQLSVLQFLF